MMRRSQRHRVTICVTSLVAMLSSLPSVADAQRLEPSANAPAATEAAPAATEAAPAATEAAPVADAQRLEPSANAPAATEAAPAATEAAPAATEAAPAEQASAEDVFDLRDGYSMTPPEEGPPFYDAKDEEELRARFDLQSGDAQGSEIGKGKRAFRCWVADPSCGWTLELQATSAYARRFRQGNVSEQQVFQWNSGRAQYDLWLNLPVVSEIVGERRYTRLTLGPKGGVIANEEQSLWGNFGVGMRYWFKQGSWSPTLEISSGVSFWLYGERGNFGVGQQRSPLGITGDIGVGVGGWGSIIVGGQVNTALARSDLPDEIRISTSGSFFVGFRGNIVWGLPAVASVATQGLTQRYVNSP